MRMSSTLSRYIGRQFFIWFLFMLAVVAGIVWLLDSVELLRRAAGKPQATFSICIQMAFFKLPQVVQQAFPFVMLFSAMYTFSRLTRSQELVVARAVGVSVWQFLAPALIVAPLIGCVLVGVINPVGSTFFGRYQKMEDRYLRNRTGTVDFSQSGLWLRQADQDGRYVIHADQMSPQNLELHPVMVFLYTAGDDYIGRIDGASATLQPGYWEIRDAWLNRPKRAPEFLPVYQIRTELTLDTIRESFAKADTVGFWELPHFIQTLESTGFPATRHRLHYQSLLTQPLLFCAMVLFGAAFSLRQTRRGGALMMIGGGIITGFVLFVFNDVILAFGISETIPVMMAAWAPALASLLLGVGVLLHLEDG